MSKYNASISDDVIYAHTQSTEYTTKIGLIHKRCVLEFCHSNESLSIDSNSCKILIVNGKKHVGRVWLFPTIREQYTLFLYSEIVNTNENLHNDFIVPSMSHFYHDCYVCVSKPVIQSCIDLCTSALKYYMHEIGNYIRVHRYFREQLCNCDYDQHQLLISNNW